MSSKPEYVLTSTPGRGAEPDSNFYRAFKEITARREARILAGVCEHLCGPWGRVPGKGALVVVERHGEFVKVGRS